MACPCSSRKLEAEYGFSARALPAGAEGTLEYRVFFANQRGERISPWHSIPLFADGGLLNMVCEIPRGTRAKFEVATGEAGNPIKQDVKKGKLRRYGIDMEWNYGMLPQTWEDPAHASADCGGFVGDNDPVDVVELGDHDPASGAVYAVKPVAALAMIDEGELDWKIVAVAARDPRCALVNDVADVEMHFPGQLAAIREWFRTYKTHDGKPLNAFELNEEFVGRDYTMDVIRQTHGFWRALVERARAGQGEAAKVAVGDVPIYTACTGEAPEEPAAELADTMMHVLEAITAKAHPEQRALERPSAMLGA